MKPDFNQAMMRIYAWYEQAVIDRPPVFDWNNPYPKKLESLTRIGLEHCMGKFLVGYSDLHGGMDVLAALRGTEPLLWDLVDNPDIFSPVPDQITMISCRSTITLTTC